MVSSPSRHPPPQPPSSLRCHRQPRSQPPTTHSASPAKSTTTPHPSNSHNSRPTVLNHNSHSSSSSNFPATARGSPMPQQLLRPLLSGQLLLLLHLLNKTSTKSSHSPKTFHTASCRKAAVSASPSAAAACQHCLPHKEQSLAAFCQHCWPHRDKYHMRRAFW